MELNDLIFILVMLTVMNIVFVLYILKIKKAYDVRSLEIKNSYWLID